MIAPFNEEDWSKNVHVDKSNVFHTLEWKRVLQKTPDKLPGHRY